MLETHADLDPLLHRTVGIADRQCLLGYLQRHPVHLVAQEAEIHGLILVNRRTGQR